MRGDEILLLGIGIQPPWQLVDQHLDTSTQPHKLHLQVEGERGARYPCPQCGALCPAHDFSEKRYRGWMTNSPATNKATRAITAGFTAIAAMLPPGVNVGRVVLLCRPTTAP